jgi:phospholipid/cholesterol/gamma-HCH transport system substrate-binding protein
MKEKKEELIVGIVVTLGVLLLVLGIVWGKKADLLEKRFWLTVRFENIRGLEKGDPVVVRGIRQGEVDNIRLDSDYAGVRLWVKRETPLFSDARAFVEDRDLMGGKQIRIESGKGPGLLSEKTVLIGCTRLGMLDALSAGGKAIGQIDSLLIRLKDIANPERMNGMMKNFEEASVHAKGILAENRVVIRSTLRQLEEITRTFKEDSTAARFGKTVTQLDCTVATVKRLVRDAEKEDGTLKRLIQDKKLYDHLVVTAADLDSLIKDVKKHPGKYIHVSVF